MMQPQQNILTMGNDTENYSPASSDDEEMVLKQNQNEQTAAFKDEIGSDNMNESMEQRQSLPYSFSETQGSERSDRQNQENNNTFGSPLSKDELDDVASPTQNKKRSVVDSTGYASFKKRSGSKNSKNSRGSKKALTAQGEGSSRVGRSRVVNPANLVK